MEVQAIMATQKDLQELLRLQTARRMPIKDAMAQVKALQAASLRRSVELDPATKQGDKVPDS